MGYRREEQIYTDGEATLSIYHQATGAAAGTDSEMLKINVSARAYWILEERTVTAHTIRVISVAKMR